MISVDAKMFDTCISMISIASSRMTDKSKDTYNKLLMSIEHGKMKMVTSDGIISMMAEISIDAQEETDKYILDASRVRSYVKNASGKLRMSKKDSMIIMQYGTSRAEFASSSYIDFPVGYDNISSVCKTVNIDSESLASIIRDCSDTISEDPTKGVQYGMNLKISMLKSQNKAEYTIHGTSIDGHRMTDVHTKKEREFDDDESSMFDTMTESFVLTKECCQSLARFLSSAEKNGDEVEIGRLHRSIFLKYKNVRVTCSILEGVFPDLSRALSYPVCFKMEVDRDKMIEMLSRANSVNDVDPRVTIECESNVVSVEAKHEKSNIYESASCKTASGKLRFGINGLYVESTIKLFKKSSTVTFLFCGNDISNFAGPVLVRSDSYPNFTRVIMPMKEKV